MTDKISSFVICVETNIYLLLYNLHDSIFKCCLLHKDMILPRHAIFCIFSFIAINLIDSLKHPHLFIWTYLFFINFSLRVLLSFCLTFCQFQPGVAYKSVAYKKSMYMFHLKRVYTEKVFRNKCFIKAVDCSFVTLLKLNSHVVTLGRFQQHFTIWSEAVARRRSVKKMFYKFCKIHRKTPV